MLANQWLIDAQKQLERNRISSPRLDALVLLESTLKMNRALILAKPELELLAAQERQLNKLLSRRLQHEPIAYIRKQAEFYGYNFVISPSVLVPRPESETIIELLKMLSTCCSRFAEPKKRTKKAAPVLYIADVGTGSGALGITAKLELPESEVDLLDISKNALLIARTNVDKFTLNISTIESNLLTNGRPYYDVLLCNLPYVPDDYYVNEAAQHEPRIALFGGPDGLNVYRELFKQIHILQKRPLFILTESLPSQHAELEKIARLAAYRLDQVNDFIQLFVRHK